jgi:Protein of unknown function (DUF3306)
MTDEDFLKRWSRRKREAAEVERSAPPAATMNTLGATAPRGDIAAEIPATAEQPPFDPASLPPIESLNALSDVTAFLRAGVPAELTRAALRRVWTADPAISEFVGLAENAWDFTDPAAIPGFGPLEMTDDVRRMIAQVIDQIGQAPKTVGPVADERVGLAENSKHLKAIDRNKTEDDQALPADGTQQNDDAFLGNKVLAQCNTEAIAPQHAATEPPEEPKQISSRSHGGALPR